MVLNAAVSRAAVTKSSVECHRNSSVVAKRENITEITSRNITIDNYRLHKKCLLIIIFYQGSWKYTFTVRVSDKELKLHFCFLVQFIGNRLTTVVLRHGS